MAQAYDHKFKLLLTGDSGVGKSSILTRFTDDNFDDDSQVTTGVDFKVKAFTSKADKKVKLTVWDTAGQERFRTLTSSYYMGAHGVILVYDCTKTESLTNLFTQWMTEVNQYIGDQGAIMMLVCNKTDLADKRKISTEMGQEYANKNGALYIEVSAKTGDKIGDAFEELVEKILETPSLLEDNSSAMNKINVSQPKPDEGNCAC